MYQRLNGDSNRSEIEQHKISSSSRLTAIKRLADYCKQYSVIADIVMSTDKQTSTHPEKQ
jgi:hypothetical protein